MKWCCDGIKYMYDQRHSRTIYVYAEPASTESAKPIFWIAMRCVEQVDLDKMKQLNLHNNIPITISTRMPINYCPWCGVKLTKFYHKLYIQLEDQELINEFATLAQ